MGPEEPEDHCTLPPFSEVSLTLDARKLFEVQLSLSSKAYGRSLRLCEEYRG